MPGMQNITIIDRAGTPKTHIYAPENASSGVGSFVERLADGSFVGEPKLSASARVTPSRRGKSVVRMAFPKVVTEVINGVNVPRVAGTSYFKQEIDWDPLHTAAERDAILGQLMKVNDTKANQPFLQPVVTAAEMVFSG